MARKNKTVPIEGYDGQVTVYELTVRDIYEFINSFKEGNVNAPLIGEKFDALLPKATNIEREAFLDFAPSDIKLVYDAFEEVNEVFFGLVRKMGLFEALSGLKDIVTSELKKAFAVSLEEGTSTETSGTTAGASTSQP